MTGTPGGLPRARRGRPAVTTCETIEEAACELFLEQGYAATSVDDIARRAGVSRSSFFNYVDGKGELLWGPVRRELERVPDAIVAAAGNLGGGAPRSRAVEIVCRAAIAVAGGVSVASIPPAVAQADAMGARTAVAEAGAALVLEQARRLRVELRALDPDGDEVDQAAFAWAVVGAVAAAAEAWMRAGTSRGSLEVTVERALAPIAAAFAR